MPEFSMACTEGLHGERIIKLGGPFTLSALFEFQDSVRRNPPSITIIDLSNVPYMDSAALGSLLGFHVSCQQHNRRYGLVGVSDRMQTLFRVAGVSEMLATYGSLADAEAGLGGKAALA